MSNIVIFHPDKPAEYLKSVHTPDYCSSPPPTKQEAQNYALPNVIINPDLSNVQGVPKRFWKKDGLNVVEMTDTEKQLVRAQAKADRRANINKLNFGVVELAEALINKGLITKKEIVDYVKGKEGVA